MRQAQIDLAKFRDVVERPNIQRMLTEFDPYQFEDFVGYVLTRAGFIVEDTATQYGPGLDLKLYTMPTPVKRLHSGVSVNTRRRQDTGCNGCQAAFSETAWR